MRTGVIRSTKQVPRVDSARGGDGDAGLGLVQIEGEEKVDVERVGWMEEVTR
jgi:hypothetical protein